MKTEFFFKILSNDVAPTEGNIDLVIKSVFMNTIAKSDDGFTSEYGCQYDLPSPSPASYTPFEKVTEPMMVDWVKEMYAETVSSVQANLENDISISRGMNVIKNYPLPFA